MPFEQVILWNPQVILTTDPNFWLRVERSALARGRRREPQAGIPVAAPALRLVRLPTRREPAARGLVGGKLLEPEVFGDLRARRAFLRFYRVPTKPSSTLLGAGRAAEMNGRPHIVSASFRWARRARVAIRRYPVSRRPSLFRATGGIT
jgi:hypothetical protein